MVRRIYHGSDHVIQKPEYGFGKPYNDYGLGFYCTENIDMAKEWAVTEDQDGFANAYDLDMEGMTVLNLNDGSYTVMNWLAILLENRTQSYFNHRTAKWQKGELYIIQILDEEIKPDDPRLR